MSEKWFLYTTSQKKSPKETNQTPLVFISLSNQKKFWAREHLYGWGVQCPIGCARVVGAALI